jgi:hypothetical protein
LGLYDEGGLFSWQTGALITPQLSDGVSVITPLLDLYGREAAAYVQAERLKAVAVV